MLRINKPNLVVDQDSYLKDQQQIIDDLRDYPDKVEKAKALWSSKNSRHFTVIRKTLESCCAGASRCHYCEDSVADEVEHFRPKDFFPEATFQWDNYLFACGPCNGRKNNSFPLITTTGIEHLVRKKNDPVVPPPVGTPAIVDILNEDPGIYLRLDILETFRFSPRGEEESRTFTIGKLTIDTLHLNTRENLTKARKEAFGDYHARLQKYVEDKHRGASSEELARQGREILKKAHPFVWFEIRRSQSRVPELARLFREAPELL